MRIYSWDGDSWVQRGEDIDGEAADRSGFSVTLTSDGDTVAIGSPRSIVPYGCVTCAGSSGDLVRVYDWDGDGWLQRGGDINGESTCRFLCVHIV